MYPAAHVLELPVAGHASVFGQRNTTATSCGVPFQRGYSCRTWGQWTEAGMDKGSLWQVDPKLTGPLRLVSAKEALELGIEPLTELVRAGADWEL